MAVGNRNNQAQAEPAKTAIGYFNVTVLDSNGKARKVDSLQLNSGNPVHEQIDAFMRTKGEEGLAEIWAKFQVQYNPIDQETPDLGLL